MEYPNNFYLGKAEKINLEAEIVTMGETSIPYDYLILAPGAETNFYNISGAEKYSFTLKSIGDAIKIKNHLLSRMEHASHAKGEAERKKILKFVIVGGGATGVELAAEIAELISDTFARYYSKELIKDASIVLIQKDADLIPQFGVKMRGKSLEVLRKSGIEVMLSMGVTEVGVSYAIIDGGTKIDTETVIWVAGTKPATLNFDHAPERSRDGRVIVNEFLQLPNYKNVFIIGDMAAFTDKNSNKLLPGLAQVAEKQAALAAANIRLAVKGSPLRSFFYHSSGTLMSLGRWKAIGEIWGFTFSGYLAWWFWRTIYLSKLISFRKKIKVALDWTINIFSPRDISQL